MARRMGGSSDPVSALDATDQGRYGSEAECVAGQPGLEEVLVLAHCGAVAGKQAEFDKLEVKRG